MKPGPVNDLAAWLASLQLAVPDHELTSRESFQNVRCGLSTIGNISARTLTNDTIALATSFGGQCEGQLVRHGIVVDTVTNETLAIAAPIVEANFALSLDPPLVWLPSCRLVGSVVADTLPSVALTGASLCTHLNEFANSTLTPLLVAVNELVPDRPRSPPSPPTPPRSPPPVDAQPLVDWSKSRALAIATKLLEAHGSELVDSLVDRWTNGTGVLPLRRGETEEDDGESGSFDSGLNSGPEVAWMVGGGGVTRASIGNTSLLNGSVQITSLSLGGLDSLRSLEVGAVSSEEPQSLHLSTAADGLWLAASVRVTAVPRGGGDAGAPGAMSLEGAALDETLEIVVEIANASLDMSMLWAVRSDALAALRGVLLASTPSTAAAVSSCLHAATAVINLSNLRVGGAAPSIVLGTVGSLERQLGEVCRATLSLHASIPETRPHAPSRFPSVSRPLSCACVLFIAGGQRHPAATAASLRPDTRRRSR